MRRRARSTASTSESSSPPTSVPATLTTTRWCTASGWTSSRCAARLAAAPSSAIKARSRPSEKLGTASTAKRSGDQAAPADDAVDHVHAQAIRDLEIALGVQDQEVAALAHADG